MRINARVKSFRSRVEVELFDRKHWTTYVERATSQFDYLEVFHIRQSRQSSLGMRTLVEFELDYATTAG